MDEDLNHQAQADADIQAIRTEFVGGVWRALFWVALLVLPLTLVRIALNDWLPLYGYHLALGIVVLALCLLQSRFPYRWRAGILFGMLWCVGLPGLFSFGLAAPGIWWLVLSCLFAAVVYSPRFGLGAAIATGLACRSRPRPSSAASASPPSKQTVT